MTPASSNEHDGNGVFLCNGIDYGNQQGDYEGLVSYGGGSHPIWTDSRDQLSPSPGCRTGLAMEEGFLEPVEKVKYKRYAERLCGLEASRPIFLYEPLAR